jgi:hypothetical protein
VSTALIQVLDELVLDPRPVVAGEHAGDGLGLLRIQCARAGRAGENASEHGRGQHPGEERSRETAEECLLPAREPGEWKIDIAVEEDVRANGVWHASVLPVEVQQRQSDAVTSVMGDPGEVSQIEVGTDEMVRQSGVVGDRVSVASARLVREPVTGCVEQAQAVVVLEFGGDASYT